MFFKILLASLSFILISIQVTAFRKNKNHAEFNQSEKRVKSGRYEQGGTCSSNSAKKLKQRQVDFKNEDYASSSNNVDNYIELDEEIRNSLSGPGGFLDLLGTNTLEQTCNFNSYSLDLLGTNNPGQSSYFNPYGSQTPLYQQNEFSLAENSALDPLETTNTGKPPQNQNVASDKQYVSCVNELVSFLELDEHKAPEEDDDDDDDVGQPQMDKLWVDPLNGTLSAQLELALQNAERTDATLKDRVRVFSKLISAPPQIIQPQTDLTPGEHNFVRIEGKSTERRGCQRHWENFKTETRIMTKCDTCNEMLCRECHMYKHGLPSLPDVPQIPVPGNLNCVFCGQSVVNTESTLAKHLLKCKNRPDGSCRCCACGRRFPKVYNYELHLRSHSGERPFVCEVCEEGFTSKPNLKRHKKTVHKENAKKQYKGNNNKSNESAYVCETCKEEFTNKSNLRRHKCTTLSAQRQS